MDNKQPSGVGIVDPEIDEQRPADEARQARNRFWQAAERIGERNRDKDPDEDLAFITQVVEEVRQERHVRSQSEPQGGR